MDDGKSMVAFFATYRPLEPLAIFARPIGSEKKEDEIRLTDHEKLTSNYNGQVIPLEAVKKILKRPNLASQQVNEFDVESGMIFVSERENGLETLHIALLFKDKNREPKVISLADVFGSNDFNGVRMEDCGCIAGDYIVYVSTKKDPEERRQPWTVVYKTNLLTGKTDRLTPSWQADLNPVVSPSGKMIAVASFQRKSGWNGEIEDLETGIYVMNLERPFKRRLVIDKGGWPTWGSDTVIFFHRKDDKDDHKKEEDRKWGVYRYDMNNDETRRVSLENIDAMTPAAISADQVAVASIGDKQLLTAKKDKKEEYRHIVIFDSTKKDQPIQITQNTRPMADHYNPFVIEIDGKKHIGYHRCNCVLPISPFVKNEAGKKEKVPPNEFNKLMHPNPDIQLVRVSGAFPAFSSDGSKLAFVDNDFKTLWVVEKGKKPCPLQKDSYSNRFFSPVWNTKKDILYYCSGPAFKQTIHLHICAIRNVSNVIDEKIKDPMFNVPVEVLTKSGTNNAFPSSSPDGGKLVFRSYREGEEKGKEVKRLYIMNAEDGEVKVGRESIRITNGPGTDTHCQWSPTNDWIVFSSSRDKPDKNLPPDNLLDDGYFAVYLVHADTKAVVRVLASGYDIAGHVNHPFFSPDGKSIVVTSDLAAISVDPISLPLYSHSVRPYGDIFVIHIDPSDIEKYKDKTDKQTNKDFKCFTRITHSRYENSTPTWSRILDSNLIQEWNKCLKKSEPPKCPYQGCDGNEGWRMTGHLYLGKDFKRCC